MTARHDRVPSGREKGPSDVAERPKSREETPKEGSGTATAVAYAALQ